MTVEEMINFNISECVTILNHRLDTEIINGIYTISQKNEIDFNEEQIKELLLMFKPMQKELATYKKALEISCEWNELNLGYLNVDECLQKAREDNDKT